MQRAVDLKSRPPDFNSKSLEFSLLNFGIYLCFVLVFVIYDLLDFWEE